MSLVLITQAGAEGKCAGQYLQGSAQGTPLGHIQGTAPFATCRTLSGSIGPDTELMVSTWGGQALC